MKKLLLFFCLVFVSWHVNAVVYGPDCYTCFLDSSYRISTIYDSHYCFQRYDDKKLTLHGLIDRDDKKFQNKIYTVSLVERTPGILHYKKKEFVSRPLWGVGTYKDDYPLLKFESQDGTTFYHVYGYGDMPIYKTPDCDCYWNSRISTKEDKFNKITAYYFTQKIGWPNTLDQIVVMKSDSTYAISIILGSNVSCRTFNGIYILFDDEEVLKNEGTICDYRFYNDRYYLSGSLILSEEQFIRFAKHRIRALKLGGIEIDFSEAYKVMKLSGVLMNK